MFNFFKKKKKKVVFPKVDMSAIKVDMHSHLVPAIDDGSESLEDSFNLIKGLMDLGFEEFWTTPHVMSDFYRNSTDTIKSGCDSVNQMLKEKGLNVQLNPSAEYYFDDHFFDLVKSGDLLPIQGQYVLFEFSYINKPEYIDGIIKDIKAKGLQPIIAHPERYPFYFQDIESYRKVKETGAYFQINLNSLVGHYGGASKHAAQWLIDENMVEFVGTDIHRMSHLANLEKALCSEYLHKLIDSGRLMNSSLVTSSKD